MANDRGAGRKKLPADVKKERISVRLLPWMVERLGDNKSQAIESALLAVYGRKKAEMIFAFLSPDEPTAKKLALAESMGIQLVRVDDADGFTLTPAYLDGAGAFDGVIVSTPEAAMQLCSRFVIGVYRLDTSELVTWDMRE